ncbi:hypothetical protein AB0876_19805 [Mycobacterium sp. NPDC049093]
MDELTTESVPGMAINFADRVETVEKLSDFCRRRGRVGRLTARAEVY